LRFTFRSFFPTEVRLRASGICNTFGRGAIIFTSFIVVALFKSHGVGGVLVYMVGLLVVEILVVLTLGVERKSDDSKSWRLRRLCFLPAKCETHDRHAHTYDAQLFISGEFTMPRAARRWHIVNRQRVVVIGQLANAGASCERAVTAAQSAFVKSR